MSFRQVARQVNVSTPTVESRVRKLTNAGIIKKFTLLIDSDKLEEEVSTLLHMRVDLAKMGSTISSLSSEDAVRSLFVTTGDSNLVVRVALPSNKALQDFLVTKIAALDGVTLVSSQIITMTAKDEYGVPLNSEISVHLTCDTCGGEVKGKPFTLNVGEGKRFFCCKSCLSIYKEKYKAGIEAVARSSLTEPKSS